MTVHYGNPRNDLRTACGLRRRNRRNQVRVSDLQPKVNCGSCKRTMKWHSQWFESGAPERLLVADMKGGQILVTLWKDGTAEVAWRLDQWSTWGAPYPLEVAP